MQTLETLYERLVELEGECAGIKAEQSASRMITQHLETQFMELSTRIGDGHKRLEEHIHEERAHWESEIQYRTAREAEEKRQRRQDIIAWISGVGAMVVGLISVAISVHGAG